MLDEKLASLPNIVREKLAFGQQATFSVQVKVCAIVTSNIELTGYTKEGPFVFRMVHAGDGSITTTNFALPDMPLAVAMSTSATGVLKGRVYARITLRINNTVVQDLCRGYVHDLGGPAWPNIFAEESSPLKSFIRVLTGANPAAGAEVADTMVDNVNLRIIGGMVTLVTDGTAASRRVHLTIDQGQGGIVQHFFGDTDQTATTTRTYHFLPLGFSEDREDNGHIIIPIPPNLYVAEESIIGTSTTNIQAGDNFGSMTLFVEQFLSR